MTGWMDGKKHQSSIRREKHYLHQIFDRRMLIEKILGKHKNVLAAFMDLGRQCMIYERFIEWVKGCWMECILQRCSCMCQN